VAYFYYLGMRGRTRGVLSRINRRTEVSRVRRKSLLSSHKNFRLSLFLNPHRQAFTPYMEGEIEQTAWPFSRARNLGLKSQPGHLSGPAQTDKHGR